MATETRKVLNWSKKNCLRGVPASARMRDLIDVAFAIRVKQCQLLGNQCEWHLIPCERVQQKVTLAV